MRTKFTVNDESDKVDDVRANNTEVENGDFLTISKIVEQKQIFEKRLKYRQVNVKIQNLNKNYRFISRISWNPAMRSQHSSPRR